MPGCCYANESEGLDRSHICIPENQKQLLEAVAQANENLVVVLSAGSVVETGWVSRCKAVLHAYLGGQAGAEIAQLYVAKADAAVFRPEKELKGFAKVFLQAGECKTVTIPLDDKAFRYWNVKTDRWETEGGSYQLLVGASVQDIRLRAEVPVQGTGAPDPYAGKAVQCYRTADIKNVPDAAFEALLGHAIPEDKPHIDQTMTLGELNHSRSPLCWLAWAVLHTLLKRSSREGTPDLNLLFQYNMPVRALAQMTGGMVGQETVDGIVMEAKGFWIIGLLRALIGFGQNAVSNQKFRAALDAERGGPAV